MSQDMSQNNSDAANSDVFQALHSDDASPESVNDQWQVEQVLENDQTELGYDAQLVHQDFLIFNEYKDNPSNPNNGLDLINFNENIMDNQSSDFNQTDNDNNTHGIKYEPSDIGLGDLRYSLPSYTESMIIPDDRRFSYGHENVMPHTLVDAGLIYGSAVPIYNAQPHTIVYTDVFYGPIYSENEPNVRFSYPGARLTDGKEMQLEKRNSYAAILPTIIKNSYQGRALENVDMDLTNINRSKTLPKVPEPPTQQVSLTLGSSSSKQSGSTESAKILLPKDIVSSGKESEHSEADQIVFNRSSMIEPEIVISQRKDPNTGGLYSAPLCETPKPEMKIQMSQNKDETKGLFSKYKKPRKCCCCFPRNKFGVSLCLFITFLILAVLATIGYFLFPRMPEVTPRLTRSRNSADGGLKLTYDPQNQFNFTATISLDMNVTVYNPNPYRLVVNRIDLRASIQPNASALAGSGLPGTDRLEKNSILPSRNVGFGETGKITFEPRQSTNFSFEIIISLQANDFIENPYLRSEIEQVCSSDSAQPRTFKFSYVISLENNFLQAFGYTPTIPSSSNVRCPLVGDQLERLRNLVPSS